jgi:hypothetical protein
VPLDPGALRSGLPGAAGADYPSTLEACAKAWAGAVTAWAAGVVPPSATVAAAGTALEGALVAAFKAQSLTAVDAALLAFAVQVGGGMAPAFVAVPPAGPPGLAQLLAGARAETRQAGVEMVAAALDAWLRTGTATLAAPPNTLVPAWS